MALCAYGVYSFMFGMFGQFLLGTFCALFFRRVYHVTTLVLKGEKLGKYLRFVQFRRGQKVVNFISSRMDIIVIGKSMAAVVIGLYFFPQKFACRVYTKITPIICSFEFPLLSRLNNSDAGVEFGFRELTRLLCIIIFPCMCGIWAVTNTVVVLFFDERWSDAIALTRILLVVMVIRTITTQFGTYFRTRGRNDLRFIVNLCTLYITF